MAQQPPGTSDSKVISISNSSSVCAVCRMGHVSRKNGWQKQLKVFQFPSCLDDEHCRVSAGIELGFFVISSENSSVHDLNLSALCRADPGWFPRSSNLLLDVTNPSQLLALIQALFTPWHWDLSPQMSHRPWICRVWLRVLWEPADTAWVLFPQRSPSISQMVTFTLSLGGR